MSEANQVVTTLTVPYSTDAGDGWGDGQGLRLALEYHPGSSRGFDTRLRLYPDVPATLVATNGTVWATNVTGSELVNEVLSFSGSDRAQPRWPRGTGFRYLGLGLTFDKTGTPISVSFHYDADTDEVVATAPFYGAVMVRYQAAYQILVFRPDVTMTQDAGGIGGVTITTGTVYAFYQGASASLDIQLGMGEEPNYAELYRVYSKSVIDSDGPHEMPPGWPTTTDFPGAYSGHELDPDNSLTEERVHEIGWCNSIGSTFWRSYHQINLDPYFGATGYRPAYKIRWGSAPTGVSNKNNWKRAFLNAKNPELRADIVKRWPGAVDG